MKFSQQVPEITKSALREQESALIQLGELYRDEKYIIPHLEYVC